MVRALALKPKVLVVDEPFNHLDSDRARTLMEDLVAMAGNSIVIVATHYAVRELRDNAREVYELIAGSLRKLA